MKEFKMRVLEVSATRGQAGYIRLGVLDEQNVTHPDAKSVTLTVDHSLMGVLDMGEIFTVTFSSDGKPY